MGRRVLVIVNRRKPAAEDAAGNMPALIEAAGGTCLGLVDVDESDQSRSGETSALIADADLVVVLGGDGTLLTAASMCYGHGAPLVGVNLGRVGFLAEFDLATLEREADHLFGDGEIRTRDVPVLEARFGRGGPENTGGGAIRAVNEIVVAAGPPHRMLTYTLSIDGHAGPTVSGDGVIVSSPSGSTAYNVSAGGPIIAPEVAALAVTPIAAHSLSFRPIVVSSSSEVRVMIDSTSRVSDEGAVLVADGRTTARVSIGDTVRVGLAAESIRFAVDGGESYWRTLRRKMGWARRPTDDG